MANAVVIVAVPERRPKLVVTYRYKGTAIAELTGVVPVQNLAVGAGRVLRLHDQETELTGEIVLIAFFVGVETAGAGVAEREFLAAVLEVVLWQQEQAQAVQKAGLAQVARPQNQAVVVHRNFHVTEASGIHQHQAANAEVKGARARL